MFRAILPLTISTSRILLVLLLFVHLPLFAQDPTGTETTSQQDSGWQPPELEDLPSDWWDEFDATSAEVQDARIQAFYDSIRVKTGGLDAENLLVAQAALGNLESLIDLLEVTQQANASLEMEPVLTQESYTLEDLRQLRAQLRSLDRQIVQFELQAGQNEREIRLLQQRRDSIGRDYQETDINSPARIVAGIRRIAARVEYEISVQRAASQKSLASQLGQQADTVREQLDFAQLRLDSGGLGLEEVERDAISAQAEVNKAMNNVAGLQRQMMTALSSDTPNPSLLLLRKQQLTRGSAESALASLRSALSNTRLTWYQLRSGQPDPDFDPQEALSQARRLAEETLRQVEVWTSTSQDTLVNSDPDTTANAIGNMDLARNAARDTLEVIGQVRDAGDELLFLQELVSTEAVDSQSGIARAWSRISLATNNIRNQMGGLIDAHLFSIGDTTVTPGGIFKMLMILALAFGMSWFIRHLLDRLKGRRQFANSPALYTLGRLLHYIIILVGVLAALGSIGVDFTNFALIAGALSVGIGFGLQAIVNNFVSGLILLFEGSLRVGDYIELDSGLAGVVREINTRATVVNTNDAVDVVVPNSELVTTKLTNWTLRESVARMRIGFGVAYGSDKEVVRELALAAATEMDFVLLNMPGREPQIRLVNFGDSSLDFELLAWVSRQGVRRPHRVRASFLWALETRLNEAGIEIPFPQRDLHIRSDSRKPA